MLRLKLSLGFISLTAVHAAEICDVEVKGVLLVYAKLDSVIDQCSPRDLLVLGDLGTFREPVTSCVLVPMAVVPGI